MSSRAFACAGDDEREWGAGSRHMAYCSRGAFRPSLKSFRPRKSEGAGNAGCALHPRSRVPKLRIRRTRAYRFSGNTPASPTQWLYGLLRALPGDEFLFVTVVSRIDGEVHPVEQNITSADLASATDARTTRLRRTQLPPPSPDKPSAACRSLTKALKHRSSCTPDYCSRGSSRPATPARAMLPRPPHPIPTYSDDGRRPSSGMRRVGYNSDLPKLQAKYF
jgi:hypothetical protein